MHATLIFLFRICAMTTQQANDAQVLTHKKWVLYSLLEAIKLQSFQH